MREEVERMKQRLVAETVAAMEKVLSEEILGRLEAGQISLREIEEQVMAVQRQAGASLTQARVAEASSREPSLARCPECGREMRLKGKKARHLVSRSGNSRLERRYYYCPVCRRGHFPPG